MRSGVLESYQSYIPCLAAAIQCLKRKKLYEVQVEQLGNFQLRIHDQVSQLHEPLRNYQYFYSSKFSPDMPEFCR